MFTSNPFAALSASIAPAVMQAYVVIMIVLVVAGTLFEVVHKGSARYFFQNMRNSKAKGARALGGGELVSIAVQTAVVDVLASGEFCNARRRIAHLLGMYGFVLYVLATVVLVFDPAAGALWAQLWWLGGLMVCVGGYWFWFFIRVDVAAEGNSPLRIVRADLFILSMLASATLGLAWAWVQAKGGAGANVLFGLYVLATHGAVRRRAVVQVRAHVLQARGRLREESHQGRRHGRELADADPRRSRTTEKALDGTAAKRSDGHGARHQARSAPPLLGSRQQGLS